MKKMNYQAPELKHYDNTVECRLLVGTYVPVDPTESGSQSEAESKSSGYYFEEVDQSFRSYEHDPLDYLPRVFKSPWQDE